MAYTSVIYISVILGSCLLYYLAPKKIRSWVLLTVSLTVYILSDVYKVGWLLLSAVSVYAGALIIGKINKDLKAERKLTDDKEQKKLLKQKAAKKKKAVVAVGIILNFAVLAFLKYFNVFGSEIGSLFGTELFPRVNLIVPLGISYYTLQAAGYLIDVYRGKYGADKNFGRVLLFLSFFPQMVEGPIGRYDDLAPQLWEPHALDMDNIRTGVRMFAWGLFKKIVIADRAALLVNEVFDNSDKYGSYAAVLAIVLYTFQIYADFSGCMDIVRGSGRMLGVGLAENFRQPFFSKTVQEFWQRWHITLGSWLKDYVFYSASLSSWFGRLNKFCRGHFKNYLGKVIPSAAALFPVWVFNGIWHGAGLKYFLYGMYYFGLMLLGMLTEPFAEKLISKCKINKESRSYKAFQTLRTCLLVCIGMLIFRADSLSASWHIFASIFTRPSGLTSGVLESINISGGDFVLLAIGFAALLYIGILREKGRNILAELDGLKLPVRWLIELAVMLILIMFGAYGPGYPNSGFIYGQF